MRRRRDRVTKALKQAMYEAMTAAVRAELTRLGFDELRARVNGLEMKQAKRSERARQLGAVLEELVG